MKTNKIFTVFLLILIILPWLICVIGHAMGNYETISGSRQKEETRIKKAEDYISKHPELTDAKKNMLRGRCINVSMTSEEVLLCWGEPDRKSSDGDIWYYDSRHAVGNILYFKDNILIDWQQK